MIEINLLPGAHKKRKTGGAGFSPKLPGSLPAMDRMTMFIVAAWIIGPLLLLWLFLGVRGSMSDARADIEEAVADSTRFAAVIETQEGIRARQDTIAEKLQMIQEIDAGRYVWPHILDEVSRALPPFTWLTSIEQSGGGATPMFEIQGRTGSLPALTRFMDALEASPFLRNIQLINSEQAQAGEDPDDIVNIFALTGSYDAPPFELIETVPLFENADMDTADVDMDAAVEEVEDGTGTS